MNAKQAAFLVGKVIVAAAIMAWLFHRTNAHVVWLSVRDAHRIPIVAGLILWLVTMVIAGWRWNRLLGILGIHIPVISLICIVPIAQFFSVFLPGSTGDDLTRMLYVSRLAPGRVAEACTTVLLDRFIGLVSVLLLAAFCVPWQWSLMSASSQTRYIALGMLAAGALTCVGGAVFFLAGHPTHRWFEKRLRLKPAHSLRDEAARIWGVLCDNKLLVAKVVGAALITQLIHCGAFYLAGVSVGIHTPLLIWTTFVPIVLAANALPITIAGVGVREYLLVLFLGLIAGVNSERAIAASFVIFAMILMMCLLGAFLYIFYRPKRKETAIDEVTAPAGTALRP
ncbi:MAG: lysylphosphatidylglycerol synthase transmembrane domain-containing protein [Candidatus Udaeobacter sp.]